MVSEEKRLEEQRELREKLLRQEQADSILDKAKLNESNISYPAEKRDYLELEKFPKNSGNYGTGAAMSNESKTLLKLGIVVFSAVIAGAWVWSWISPEKNPNYPISEPESVQTPAWNNSITPNSGYVVSDPCEDEPTVEEYKSCIEDMALEDWINERRSEVGQP